MRGRYGTTLVSVRSIEFVISPERVLNWPHKVKKNAFFIFHFFVCFFFDTPWNLAEEDNPCLKAVPGNGRESLAQVRYKPPAPYVLPLNRPGQAGISWTLSCPYIGTIMHSSGDSMRLKLHIRSHWCDVEPVFSYKQAYLLVHIYMPDVCIYHYGDRSNRRLRDKEG